MFCIVRQESRYVSYREMIVSLQPYCPFYISRKDVFFAGRFILNENLLFRLTISYQKPFVFSVSLFCSQIFYSKIKFTARSRSDLCNFYSKVVVFYYYYLCFYFLFIFLFLFFFFFFFFFFVSESSFYFSLLDLNY